MRFLEEKVYMENIEVWLEYKEHLKIKHYSKSSLKQQRYALEKFFNYLKDKNIDLKQVTKQDIIAYGALCNEKGYHPSTIEGMLHSIKSFFKYLEQTFCILINPADTLILPAVKHRIPIVLTQKETKRILQQPNTSTLKGIRDRSILEVFYSTGIRINELIKLSIFDIDIQSGFLRITKGKFSKDRFAPLTKSACWWLKEYIKNARPRFTKKNQREQALFVGKQRGRRINQQILEWLIRDYAKSAGIKKQVTAHTFRHSYATHMLENDVDIFTIQKLLGHSQVSTTQIYTKVNPKQIKQEHSKYHPRERDKDE